MAAEQPARARAGRSSTPRGRGFRFVTCGHTHLPLEAEHDGVRYVNSGTWTDHPPCPFVAVRGTELSLEHWPMTGAVPTSERETTERETSPHPLARPAPPLPALG